MNSPGQSGPAGGGGLKLPGAAAGPGHALDGLAATSGGGLSEAVQRPPDQPSKPGQQVFYGGPSYTLPIATIARLGGVIPDGVTITINAQGVISAVASYTLPTASETVLGGVKIDGTTITINGSGVISSASAYTLPTATTADLGGVIVPASGNLSIDGAGRLTVQLASTLAFGVVKADGSTITVTAGVISAQQYALPTASTTVLGGVKVDGSTITINGAGVISSSAAYTLPTASVSVLGGVKIDGTTIIINGAGVISAVGGGGGYTLPPATTTVLGGVIVPPDGNIAVDGSGNISVSLGSASAFGLVKVDGSTITAAGGVITATYSYTLPTASGTVLGGVKVDTTTITINGSGVISATAYVLPKATTTTLGGVVVPTAGNLAVDASGNISVPKASASTFGVVEVDGATVLSTVGVLSAPRGGYLFSQILFATPTSGVSGTVISITSITLGIGDWDVWGQVQPHTGTAGSTVLQGGFTTTSGAGLSADTVLVNIGSQMGANGFHSAGLVPQRFIVTSGTQQVWLTCVAFTPGGPLSFSGFIAARNWKG